MINSVIYRENLHDDDIFDLIQGKMTFILYYVMKINNQQSMKKCSF